MSHKAKILGVKVVGAPFLGLMPPRDHDGARVEGPQVPTWSGDPHRVMGWLASAYRVRFNDHRALRCKYVREDDPYNPGAKRLVTDDAGQPVLAPLGRDPVETTIAQVRRLRPHLAAAPDLMLWAAGRAENTAWFAAARRRKTLRAAGRAPGAMPGMATRRGERTFTVLHNNGKNARLTRTGRRTGVVVVAGSNPPQWRAGAPARWQVRIRVRLSREVGTYTSVQVNLDRGQVVFTCPPAPVTKAAQSGAITGIDRGAVHTAATSDGRFYDAPDTSSQDRAIKYHQRKMAKSRRINNPSGAKRWAPTKGYRYHRAMAAGAYARKSARITDFQHKATTELVRTNDWISLESLALSNMMRSAKGTTDAPGKSVAAKAGLNRVMATAALGRFAQMVLYKSQALADAGFDQRVAMVPAHNTSRECNPCGHIAKANRKSQAVFACRKCGHRVHADTNAAANVDDRAAPAWGWTAGQPAPTGAVLVVAPAGSQGKTDPSAEVPQHQAAGGPGDELQTTRTPAKV